nr:GNAT family N-acetyltransferase [bacterium]
MLKGIWIDGDGDLTDAFSVRRAVFVQEQGFNEAAEFDAQDPVSRHVVIYDGDIPVATGRMFREGSQLKTFHLGRIAVLKAYRGQHLGDLAVRMLLDAGLRAGAEQFYLGAQQDKQGFYARYGFQPVGAMYMDEFCPHQGMAVAAKDVQFPRECEK